jgi:hypothetical protein
MEQTTKITDVLGFLNKEVKEKRSERRVCYG